ncbi:MAG: hypothetical protein IJQ89_07180 [Bacteroidales bacterium]|nr:hypothetical protein [Bacteroidales bacterium]
MKKGSVNLSIAVGGELTNPPQPVGGTSTSSVTARPLSEVELVEPPHQCKFQ